AAARVRARVADYLTAQLELHKYPEEGFDQVLAKDDIMPAFVRRWQQYLAQAEQRGDPIFQPWFAYAAIPAKEFSARAAEVTKVQEQAGGAVHPLVLAQFQRPPASMREVAERYGQLFA